jgi:hypothetical protein
VSLLANAPGHGLNIRFWCYTCLHMTPAYAISTTPTAESVFGSKPWILDAGGSGSGHTWSYSKYYFATPETAKQLADMLGGTVVEEYAISGGPPMQNYPNQLVLLPSGLKVNAGLIAQLWTHGWTQDYINTMVSSEVGFVWHYTPLPAPVVLQPSEGLMIAPVGGLATQVDGTIWKRIS